MERKTPITRIPARLAAGVGLAASFAAAAQGTAASERSAGAVVVTGNPLRSSAITAPTSVLGGTELVLRRGSTLGETLSGLPGVSSSYFGPNANRPMIRGQDGDRIRILSNSGVPLDASALSYDHAVPIDPLVIERVEVLRGPAALLYGGGAIGGVVNSIDNRIPRAPVAGPGGAAEVRYGGPATERGAGALVEAGTDAFAVHADGFWRKTDDMRVPTFLRPTEGVGPVPADTILNSASESYGGALGGSMLWKDGYLGAAVDTFRSTYGTPAEADVTIDMFLNKLTLAGEARDLGGVVDAVSGQWLLSNYRHEELEDGAVGTTFENRGSDLRLQAEHRRIELGAGTLAGVFGLQTENADFSALGDEAFVPSTTTRQWALFALEEWQLGGGSLSFGARVGQARVSSAGDAPGQDQFGPAQARRFTPFSAALGGVLDLDPQWRLSGNLAYTERAPTFYELYANGLHVATGTYEVGNPDMALEKGTNVDAAIGWRSGPNRLAAGAFYSDFSNYIALLATGGLVDTDEGPVPEYLFTGVPARLYGGELEGVWRLLDTGGQQLDLEGRFDVMRATNRALGEPLPRIPPARLTAALNWALGPWAAQLSVVHAAAQNDVPSDDVPTPGYTLVNLAGSWTFDLGSGNSGLAFVRVDNIGNELAYNASTIGTVRAKAPLPGRGVMVGVRLNF
jgi:iron complex outermembrane receptor protein